MTVNLARHADEATAAWLCGTCGTRHPIDGPAYPVCCGARCRLIDAKGTPYIGSPAERLENARAAHEEAYAAWRGRLAWSQRDLEYEGEEPNWPGLERDAEAVAGRAAHHDRVAAEVATLEVDA